MASLLSATHRKLLFVDASVEQSRLGALPDGLPESFRGDRQKLIFQLAAYEMPAQQQCRYASST